MHFVRLSSLTGFFVLLAAYLNTAKAQAIDQEYAESQGQEISISVGDTLVLGKPNSDLVFAFLDIFKKTRWDPSPLPQDEFTLKYKTYDSSTGNGFYRYFFRGDFDAAELPARYEGEKFVIKGLEVVKREKDGTPMDVLYLETQDPNTIIMVDVVNAAQFGELLTVLPAINSKHHDR